MTGWAKESHVNLIRWLGAGVGATIGILYGLHVGGAESIILYSLIGAVLGAGAAPFVAAMAPIALLVLALIAVIGGGLYSSGILQHLH